MTAASQVVCTDTPQGPCRARTGTASRVNPASQHSTHDRPDEAGAVAVPDAGHQRGAAGDQYRGDQHHRAGAVPLEQRSEDGQDQRDAGHRHAEHGGFGVGRSVDQRDIEDHQPGQGDPEQPPPLHAPGCHHPFADHTDETEQQQAGDRVPHGLRREQRCAG